jgi:hypothetical protein
MYDYDLQSIYYILFLITGIFYFVTIVVSAAQLPTFSYKHALTMGSQTKADVPDVTRRPLPQWRLHGSESEPTNGPICNSKILDASRSCLAM